MRNVKCINENWIFIKDSEHQNNEELVSLPHTWNAKDGQDGGNDYFRGPCSYKKILNSDDLPEGKRVILEINGANSSADVHFNGKHLIHHNGGYSTFRVDLTDEIQSKNELLVIVDNSANDEVYPQTADFTFYGGLYRDVNLIGVSETHFELVEHGAFGIDMKTRVNQDQGELNLCVHAVNLKDNDELVYCIKDNEGQIVSIKSSKNLNETLIVEQVHLWNGRKDPYLYSVNVQIVRDNEVLDEIRKRVGFRSFEIDSERGFILNGVETPLRGVSRHQDRWEIGNALLKEHHDEDMDLICELGANTIRLAHYQHDQYFYDLCDEKGMVVWAEIPYISRHMSAGNENAVSQMKELIAQNMHHPSIVVWGISNEITMDGAKDPDLLKVHYELNDLCHQMDPDRLTTMACLSTCGMDEEIVKIPDVVAYNHYYGWYGGDTSKNGPWFDEFHRKHPDIPIGCSEYGCEALNWHTSNPQQGDYTEEYQAYYHEELIKQLFTRKYIWATHVWNMFDFGADARAEGGENGQNHKGLMTIDRKYKKDAFYAYKAWLSDDPFVHLCGKRYVDRVEAVTKVTVYSNQPEVELFANGVSLGKKTAADHFFYFEVPNQGTTELKAVAGNYEDTSVINKVETFNEAYRLREKNAVLNWFDITEIEGYFSLNDKISDILKTFRGKLWFITLFIDLAKKQAPGAQKQQPKKKEKKPKAKKKKAPSVDSGTMDMIGSFTVLRFTSLVAMRNVFFTKEELLKMNRTLNKIKKPK
ncbi:MAG: glycoside hydrolase family 2 protein [Erysipelotrichaceae bacterium]|nr:glycoside hydrolase family 2 protein [Erysipelotrichaceae bacterium]